MAEVSFEKTGNVTGRIKIDIAKKELHQDLMARLRKEAPKTNMRGFRKGKTPVSALRKMIGNQVLGELLDTKIRESLFGYIEENEVKLIFSPQPIEDENTPTITASRLDDVSFSYDLALEPEFEITYPEEAIDYYVLEPSDEWIDEQVDGLLRNAGENVEIEDGQVEANDVLDVTITEAGPLEYKITNDVKLYVDSLSDEYKEVFLGKKKGEVVSVADLATLENNTSESYVRRYLLELDEEDDTDLSGKSWDITINTISRLMPAELNEEFFEGYSPDGEITTEEQLREDIIEKNRIGFEEQGIGMVNFQVQKALVEHTEMELPEDVMRRVNQEDPEEEEDYDRFKRGVKWMLIRNKVAADEDIKVEYEDLRANAEAQLIRMLGGRRPEFVTDEFVDNYVKRMLENEDDRNRLMSEAIGGKVMDVLREKVTLLEKPVGVDEFNDVIQQFNKENAPEEEEE